MASQNSSWESIDNHGSTAIPDHSTDSYLTGKSGNNEIKLMKSQSGILTIESTGMNLITNQLIIIIRYKNTSNRFDIYAFSNFKNNSTN